MYPRRDRMGLPERAHAGDPPATPSMHRQEDRLHRGGTARPTHNTLSASRGPSHTTHGPYDVDAPFAHPYASPAPSAPHSHHMASSYVAEPKDYRSQRAPVETKSSRSTASAVKPSNIRKPKHTSHLRFPKSPLPRPEHTLLFGAMGMAVNTGRYILDQGGAAVGGGLLYGEDGFLLLEDIDDRFAPPTHGRLKDRRRSESHAGTSRVPPPRAKRSASAPPGAPRLRPVDLPPMRD
ncbi:uncharacterized protein SCHCODRAFT_02062169 [Schizophyllum commune H4-8]|uniref:uncharacterized protein n=1 Tax=Schizophyllum commune (strain H4-8 / FGSC 9210) TaxID=578458 RepID=UPI00215EC08E|nr:uncharacterized protein SCHCODRAFT_02062169 [Schizophyllum commune H4-8]KAI5888781.1 hypothetical protein SCHCODRAFT_02062169 [Schizophyllum commune H4-8]